MGGGNPGRRQRGGPAGIQEFELIHDDVLVFAVQLAVEDFAFPSDMLFVATVGGRAETMLGGQGA
jgi:hypothetical protein